MRYTYGFFATEGDSPVINPRWERFHIDNYYITHDKTIEFSSDKGEKNWIIVYGKIMSLKCDSIVHSEISNYLYKKLKKSLNSFYNELDYCCGRFIVIYSSNDQIFILNDATGMKAVYYTEFPRISVASHVNILAELYEKSPAYDISEDIEISGISKGLL